MIGILALSFTAGLAQPTSAVVGAEGEWIATGPPATPSGSIITLGTLVSLPDRTALLVGASVQRYLLSTGDWAPAGSLQGNGGVATFLGNGKVLVSGLSPAEVYDPASQVSTLTGAMNFPRRGHQATLLLSGDVLVSGGVDSNGNLVGPAEIYHPGSGTWTITGTMNNPRTEHTAILLPSGNVLVAGGATLTASLTSAELYQPGSGTWALTTSNNVGGSVSVALPGGKVLVVGISSGSLMNAFTASQIFDPATATWSDAVTVPGVASSQPKALIQLDDGRDLLVVGAFAGACFFLNASLYDPAAGTWSPASSPLSSGDFPSLALLPDGRALLAFIRGCNSNLQPAAELFRANNATARLDVNPASLDFGNIHPGGSVGQTINVQNTGGAHLDGSAVLTNSPGFSLVSGAAYSLDPGASTTTGLNFSAGTFGAFAGTATFRSNGGWIQVPLSGTVGFLLSGRIARTDGTGVASLPLHLLGPVSTFTTTDANGNYSFSVPPGSYTILPSDASLTSSPPNRNVVVVNADIGGLDFEVPIALVAAVLPSSRAVQIDATATAFAAVINSSTSEATACGISPITSLPVAFTYQTTDPATNTLTGTPNTPVSIPAGQVQTYVFAFTPRLAIPPTDVQLSFGCSNTNPAVIVPGVDTFLLSASPDPRPDMVALAATLRNDGITDIPGLNATGVFAVATVNVAAAGTITAVADTGGVSLPVVVSLCQTVPATGLCQALPSSSVTISVAANATPTLGVFVTGTGTAIPFNPAVNRIFVRLKDQAGVTLGSTSVAVRTQP